METTATGVSDRVKAIIAELLDVKVETITDEASFAGDLEASSLEIAQLATTIEDEFGVYISDASLERLVTVRDAIDFVIFLGAAKQH
ncbi:acyl carrier protein [Ensifer adhaerens]|uniref:Acyl carrier protein n=1 Tax=Ensifer adhaerens TaxID=106592 RepID=A0A9Q9DDV1_ENSAD|nr:acyl carrier protein [Ensifer adhaerens]USJ27352.1 acyl carrier protein [Ensifer adhaerens]UTV41058.1 acyl carrier protein [Ensifer adhaerens]